MHRNKLTGYGQLTDFAFYGEKLVAKMQEYGGYDANGKNDIHIL